VVIGNSGKFGSPAAHHWNLSEVLTSILFESAWGVSAKVANNDTNLTRGCYWTFEGEAFLVTKCKVAPCLGSSNLFALLFMSPT
jgi:hypothetical protein